MRNQSFPPPDRWSARPDGRSPGGWIRGGWIRASFAIALSAVLLSCAPSSRDRGSAGGAPVGSPQEREVLEAIRLAFGLEERLWGQRERIRTKEDLVTYFRQGFCEEEARRMADYLWLEGQAPADGPPLRVGEPIFLPPDRATVEELKADRATVRLEYKANTRGTTAWPAQAIRLTLQKDGEGWKVCGFHSAETVTEAAPAR